MAGLKGYLNYGGARFFAHLGFVKLINFNPLALVASQLAPEIIFKSIDGIYALGCLVAGPRERVESAESSDSFQSNSGIDRFRKRIWTVVKKYEEIEEKVDRSVSRLLRLRTSKDVQLAEEKLENVNLSIEELDALFELNPVEKIRKVFFSVLKETAKVAVGELISYRTLAHLGVKIIGSAWLAPVLSFNAITLPLIVTSGLVVFIMNLSASVEKQDSERKLNFKATKFIVKTFNPNQEYADLKMRLAGMKELDLTSFNEDLTEPVFNRLMSLCPDVALLKLKRKQLLTVKNFNLKLKEGLAIECYRKSERHDMSTYKSLWMGPAPSLEPEEDVENVSSFGLYDDSASESELNPGEIVQNVSEETIGEVDVIVDGNPKKVSLHLRVLTRFSVFKEEFSLLNKDGDVNSEFISDFNKNSDEKSKAELGEWLKFAYTGVCPFHQADLYLLPNHSPENRSS